MVTRGESDEESEGGEILGRESSMSGEKSEEQVRYPSHRRKGKIAGYERQRLSRIAENKVRMEALGIYKAANALMGSSPNCTGKRNSGEEDDDYRPDHDEEDVDDEIDGEDVKFLGNSTSGFRKRKVRNNTSVSKRKVLFKKNMKSLDTPESDENDSEDELKKAIALSLQDCVRGGDSKEKPVLMSGTQMTDDELVIYFYEFDEAGKGLISERDVERMGRVHDFTWTEEEVEDMIRCFDMDRDGKLSLDEFRNIVRRCRMLKQS